MDLGVTQRPAAHTVAFDLCTSDKSAMHLASLVSAAAAAHLIAKFSCSYYFWTTCAEVKRFGLDEMRFSRGATLVCCTVNARICHVCGLNLDIIEMAQKVLEGPYG